ncbi:hypothetical protein LPJ61_007053, partial [Coemansia biformis]
VDGWRVLSVAGIIATYIYMVCFICRARRRTRHAAGIIESGLGSFAYTAHVKSRPAIATVPHYSAIDSGPASNVTSDGRGLFSQSIHNVHHWALSKLGRSNADTAAFGALRAKIDTAAVSAGEAPAPCRTIGLAIGAPDIAGNDEPQGGNAARPQSLTTPSVARSPRSYYEQFKRSFVNNIVRWFTITTDIPSPTFPPSIFDSIGRDDKHEATAASSSTIHCEFCSSSTDITA